MREQSLTGRVAVVTGAGRGIGAAIARRLAAAGATTVCTGRSLSAAADGDTVAAIRDTGGDAVALACDVTDAASRAATIAAVLSRCGRIDILVNNAGTSVLQTPAEMDFATVRSQTEQYFLGPLHLSLMAAEAMRRQGEGWIVNLGSSSALPVDVGAAIATGAGATLAAYGAIKAAVHRLTQGLAVGLHGDNIAVNAVAPVAVVDTPGIRAQGIITPAVEAHLEPVEHIAEATLSLVEAPPRERTGVIAFSYRWLDEIGRDTMSLDGRSVVQSRAPARA